MLLLSRSLSDRSSLLPGRGIRLLAAALAPIVGLALMASLPGTASAGSADASPSAFRGATGASVRVMVDDATAPGSLQITLELEENGYIGDLRSFYAHVSDESLLAGLVVSGAGVTGWRAGANAVRSVGKSTSAMADGSPCNCDLGIALGTPGWKTDDIRSITFTLSHVSENLDISLLDGQSFAIRVNKVGQVGGRRRGKSKLGGVLASSVTVAPEPTTAVLMMLGLAGLASVGRRDSV